MKLLTGLILAIICLALASPVPVLFGWYGASPVFALTYQPPVIIRIEPTEGRQDERFDLHIYGVNFQKGAILEFRPSEGIEVEKIEVPLGGNHLIARVRISENAPLGVRDLITINPNKLSDVLTRAFTVLRAKLKERPKVEIAEINFNPKAQDVGREWIKIRNTGKVSYSLKDWTISDRSGEILAELPDWEIPPEGTLIIYFAQGRNDPDFSDGLAEFYTGEIKEIFGNKIDEAALYAGPPSSVFIVDFFSWSTGAYLPGKAHEYALEAGIWEKDKFLDISGLKEGEPILREEIQKFIGEAPIIKAHDLSFLYNTYIEKVPSPTRWFLGSGLARGEFVFADGYQMPVALEIHRGKIIKVEPWVDDDEDGIPNVWERAEFFKVNFNLYIAEIDLKEAPDEAWQDEFEKIWRDQIKYRAIRANDKAKLALFDIGLKTYFFARSAWLFVKSKFGR